MTLRGLCAAQVVTVILTAASASAQQDAAPPDPKVERVSVKLADSKQEIRGRLLHLDAQTLTIQEDRHDGDGMPARKRLDVPMTRVLRIDVEKHDSLFDGAILGALYVAACVRWWCQQGASGAPNFPRDIFLGAGMGALVGGGIDAVLFNRTTIYKAGDPIVPRPAGAGAGVSIRLRF